MHRKNSHHLLIAGLLLILSGSAFICFCQDTEMQRTAASVDLLKLNGSKPNLSPDGEGITSIKTADLFKLGVTHVKPFDLDSAIELPAGYKLFHKLAYVVDSEAVFSGPNDFTFRIPSAATNELFENLRILFAAYNEAEPKKPRWVDATIEAPYSEYWERYLSKSEFDKRLPDFKTRALHGLTEEGAGVLIVAVKDQSIARDNFFADLALKTIASGPSVMEGREIVYSFQITNNGPDKATGIWFKSYVALDFVSLKQSQGLCRWEAHNIYCNLGELSKGTSATITFRARCSWNFYVDDKPSGSDPDVTPQIGAAEGDPDYENNNAFVSTPVDKDPNKAPIAELVSPKRNEPIPGSDAKVPILIRASDPDGFITDVEVFDWEQSIGKATLKSDGEYELIYDKPVFGRHWLQIKVTDNLGRENHLGSFEFFVNGLAEVEIINPKPGSKLGRREGGIPVAIHATHPNLKIKEVTVYLTGMMSGITEEKAAPVDGDNYAATITDICKRDCELVASVIDANGIETRSIPVNFKIAEPPKVTLYQYDGEDVRPITEEQPFDSSVSLILVAEAEHRLFEDLRIVRIDFFANEKLIGSYSKTEPDYNDNRLIQCELNTLAPGTYRVQAVATDSDGSVGKSPAVQITIKPR